MVRSRLVALAVVTVVASMIASCAAPTFTRRSSVPGGAVAGGAETTARPVPVDPRIGALFIGGTPVHSCTAGVLDSLAGNLIITAAHCLDASTESLFAPGYDGNTASADFWRVDAAYLDPRWIRDQDPAVDVAIARVSHVVPDDGATLERRVGGGLVLGTAPGADVNVAVSGYPSGEGGEPIGCSGPTVLPDHGFPAVRCRGLGDGTSGAPWVSGATVRGVVGGLHSGGCGDSDVTYSSPFDLQIRLLYQRAQAGGPGDEAIGAPDDGCSVSP